MRPSEFQQKNPVQLDVSRSRFEMHPRWTGTFNSFELVPVFTYTDILPGDTFKMDCSFVLRMSTPVVPVMDDLWLDVAFYFVPHELILSRSYMSPSTNDSNHSWKAFIGAQDSLLNMPVPDSGITLPYMYIEASGSYYAKGGVADCMGIPPAPSGKQYRVNCLAPLAFMAVYNENYRDPSTVNPGVFSINSNVVSLTWEAAFGDTSSHDTWSSALLPRVSRFHGYFGSLLPWPQRNNTSVLLPLGTSANVIGASTTHSLGINGLLFESSTASVDTTNRYLGSAYVGTTKISKGYVADADTSADGLGNITGTNLIADLANASAVSINTFRLAVQEQRWYEALARGGNRIDELTAAIFGVVPHDAGGNQPEYLGGKRIPIQVSQVTATANSDVSGADNQTVGSTGAFSLTSDSDYYFTKSFDKWGSIIGVACVRYRDSFGYSLNRMFTRHERLDWYFPQFANLGEQPVYKHEAQIDYVDNSQYGWPSSPVFGYQEAWADYRTIPDIVTGLCRPLESLKHWTYANYDGPSGAPGTLTMKISSLASFLNGQYAKQAVDRTLQVASSVSGLQFLGQFEFGITAVRPMPLYSIPGLVDHH